MSLLIDGYNLMYAASIAGRGRGPGGLERWRQALLNFIVESVDARELERSAVVFDAQEAPAELPRRIVHRGLTVHFASNHDDADELIEELIKADSAPRRLTVVSSDHRLQRAARRRDAKAIDSEVWYLDVVRRRAAHRGKAAPVEPIKPEPPFSPGDVDFWVKAFADAERSDEPFEEERWKEEGGKRSRKREG